MQTDYAEKSKIILSYPDKFYNNFEALIPFYDELISLIPNNFQIWIITNNNQTIQKLKDKFNHKKIDFLGIKGWDEIWLRDCIGFVKDNYVIKPEYFPKYCLNSGSSSTLKYYLNINKQSRIIIKEILQKEIIGIPLLLDGGNFVNNSKYAIITEKILEDNGIYSQREIEQIIADKTGLQPIIVERNKCDSIGHIDAYLSFIDDSKVVIPNYPSFPFLMDDIDFINHLDDQLKAIDIEVIKMEDRPIDEIGLCGCNGKKRTPCIYSARGNYINFLRINNLIILPEFTLPTKKESNYYNKINADILEELGFEVRRINCDSIAKFGGVLRCLSYLA